VTFIKSIIFQTETNAQLNVSFPELSYDPFSPSNTAFTSIKPSAPSTVNTTELPTCPVCLDRMDDSTGLVTILCQHVFHGDCIKKWRGTGCPVCRRTNPALASTSFNYDPENPPFGSGEAPLCSTCDSTEDLWICLLCGNVGCGRYKGGHQKDHWKETAHNLALEIETQHIWDYAVSFFAGLSTHFGRILTLLRRMTIGPIDPSDVKTTAKSWIHQEPRPWRNLERIHSQPKDVRTAMTRNIWEAHMSKIFKSLPKVTSKCASDICCNPF